MTEFHALNSVLGTTGCRSWTADALSVTFGPLLTAKLPAKAVGVTALALEPVMDVFKLTAGLTVLPAPVLKPPTVAGFLNRKLFGRGD